MLKGWVMMNQSCPTPGCSVPLLRSPGTLTPAQKFCVKCSGRIDSVPQINSQESNSSISRTTRLSGASTPPTEVSSSFEPPDFVPPVETEQARRRREQSDCASSEIAQRLLRNWTLLGEDCPNTQCYGIPLLRPPRFNGGEEVKECVICGTVYATRICGDGISCLTPVLPEPQARNRETEDPRGITSLAKAPVPHHQVVLPPPGDNGIVTAVRPDTSEIEESELALRFALRTLTTRLTNLSDSPQIVDPSSIAQTAEGLGKVAQALSRVRELQWQEGQPRRA